MTGWNLPPGCNVSDIPGNRPEDEKWDTILGDFYTEEHNKLRSRVIQHYLRERLDLSPIGDDSDIDDLIYEAIHYGYDVAIKEIK